MTLGTNTPWPFGPIPLALFDGKSIRMSTGKDKEAQSAVERLSDRPQTKRSGK